MHTAQKASNQKNKLGAEMLEAKIQQIRRAETMNFKEKEFRHRRASRLKGNE